MRGWKCGDEKAGDEKSGDENVGMKMRGWKCGNEKSGDELSGDEKSGGEKTGDENAGMKLWGWSVTQPHWITPHFWKKSNHAIWHHLCICKKINKECLKSNQFIIASDLFLLQCTGLNYKEQSGECRR